MDSHLVFKIDVLEAKNSDEVVPDQEGQKYKRFGQGTRAMKRKQLDVTRMWQESWVAKYTWGEGKFINGVLVVVICVVCTSIDGLKKSIMLKNDNLAKHQGKRTCLADRYLEPYLLEGKTCVAYNCQHLKNCKEWASRKPRLVANQVQIGLQVDCKRKEVQFSTLYEVLVHGRPMIDYERIESLLKFLRVKNMPSKHWSKSIG